MLDYFEEREERVFLVEDLLSLAHFAPSDGDAVEEGLDFGNREGCAFQA